MTARGGSLAIGVAATGGGGGGNGNATSLQGVALAATVGTPSTGQFLTYTTAGGGQYVPGPAPSALGSIAWWNTGATPAAWALSPAPGMNQSPVWNGTAWSMGRTDAAALQGVEVLGDAPATGQGLRYNGVRWAPADVDAALLRNVPVDPLLSDVITTAGHLLVTDEDGALTASPRPTREGQVPRWHDTAQAYRQVGGEVSVSLATAVSGGLTLTDDQVDADVIRLTGAPTDDTVVLLPVRPGRRWNVVCESTDGSKLIVVTSVGSSQRSVVLPGETRQCWQVGAHLRTDADALVLTWSRTYGAGAAGTYPLALATIPSGYEITSFVERRGGATGGTVSTTAGVASGGTTLLAASTAGSTDLRRGRKVSELGTAFQTAGEEGLYLLPAQTTIWHGMTVSAAGMSGVVSGVVYLRRVP